MNAPKATQVIVTLRGEKATVISGSDMDMTIHEDGRLTVYDYPSDRAHSGPVFAAVRGEWLTAALSFQALS